MSFAHTSAMTIVVHDMAFDKEENRFDMILQLPYITSGTLLVVCFSSERQVSTMGGKPGR